MPETPERPAVRRRIWARLFGGVSGGVFRGMATLAFGSGIGSVIGIAAIPVLTRLYSPEDFGVLAVFTALVAILAPLVTLRYVLALPLPRHDGVAINLLAISTCLMLILSAMVALALWLGGEALVGLVSMQVLAPWWWLVALGVLGTAAYEMLTLWATRKRAYKVIAQTNVTQSAAGAAVKIAFGLLSVQPLGLLVGQLVAQASGIGRLMRDFFIEFRTKWRYISKTRMRKTAWRYRGFPIWRVPSQFLMVFSMQAPLLFIAALYDPQITGQFGLAIMALSVPISILGQSAGKALYGEAARVFQDQPMQVTQMAREVQFRLILLALLPTAILFTVGEEIFVVFFGIEWRMAGSFASIMAIAMLFQFTSAPLVQLINLLSNQIIFLSINVIRILGLVAVFVMAFVFELDAVSFVKLHAAFTTFFYLGVTTFILHAFSATQPHRVVTGK